MTAVPSIKRGQQRPATPYRRETRATRSIRLNTLKGLADLAEGLGYWRLWTLLGWAEVRQRYRRSTLGPLWLTISMAIQMFVMGVLISFLFQSDFSRTLPYVCAGIIFWTFFLGVLNDGAVSFASSAGFMLQVKRPLSLYLFQAIWRNVIMLGHNFVIFVVIAAIYRVFPSPTGLVLWILGFGLDVVCLTSIALFGALVSVRYRDFPMILQSSFQVLFWLTPLMFFPEQFGRRQYLLNFNPFTHLLALVRDPLLGHEASALNWICVAGMALVGWSFTILLYGRYRPRVVYWL